MWTVTTVILIGCTIVGFVFMDSGVIIGCIICWLFYVAYAIASMSDPKNDG